MNRNVYLISDLHLGGAPGARPGDRGFRMTTRTAELTGFLKRVAAIPGAELVINGDFVDFLAESHPPSHGEYWQPFIHDPQAAAETFDAIAERMPELFKALGLFAGRLTLLLGNHDLELALPAVREAFGRATGLGAWGCRFLFDNQALTIGTALVEHGNRYDDANVVDYDGLRRLVSLQSRGLLQEARDQAFEPPAGSRLVSTVINELKASFSFIDLLKPQSEALLALVLALDPDRRDQLGSTLWNLRSLPWRIADRLASNTSAAMPTYESEISRSSGEDRLGRLLEAALRPESRELFSAEPIDYQKEVSAGGAFRTLEALLRGRNRGWQRRVEQLRAALQALRDDQTLSREVETGKRYLEAAQVLSQEGRAYSHVIFGHTHHAKDLALPGGGRYLNSGTWTDLMTFPEAALDPDLEKARIVLEQFMMDCGAGRLESYIDFQPGYVHLEVENGETRARYRRFDWEADRLDVD